MNRYKALDHNQNTIVTVIARNTDKARQCVEAHLTGTDGNRRRRYFESWQRNHQALLEPNTQTVTNLFEIEIPDDLETEQEARFDLAILQAREEALQYTTPCQWTLISDDESTVTIEREYRNS